MMAAQTEISWCDSTFNPWWGCTKVSAACDFCYAEALDKRTGGSHWGAKAQRRRTSQNNWSQPRKWQRQADAFEAEHGHRRRVFCASMADVFDNQVPSEWRDDLWSLVRECDRLDWLLLTKRPQNMVKMLPDDWGKGWAHVWLGTTAEDQVEADRRIPHLLATPAAVRFVSVEPLLGPVDLYNGDPDPRLGGHEATHTFIGDWWEPGDNMKGPSRHGLDWVIVGGESGAKARPMQPDWARSVRDQCAAADVPFLFKQWGGRTPKAGGNLLDGRQHHAWPASPASDAMTAILRER
jgi:protein gp37